MEFSYLSVVLVSVSFGFFLTFLLFSTFMRQHQRVHRGFFLVTVTGSLYLLFEYYLMITEGSPPFLNSVPLRLFLFLLLLVSWVHFMKDFYSHPPPTFPHRRTCHIALGAALAALAGVFVVAFVVHGKAHPVFATPLSPAIRTAVAIGALVIYSGMSVFYAVRYATYRVSQKAYTPVFLLLTLPISLGLALDIIFSFADIVPPVSLFSIGYVLTVALLGYWFVMRVMGVFEDLRKSRRSITYFLDKTKESNKEMIRTLATTLELRDKYTAGHSERVRDFSYVMAWALGLDKDKKDILNAGCLFHDIGKIGVPELILNKPGSLTYEEYEQIKRHVTIGKEILSYLEDFTPFLDIIYLHHERIDGKGYPEGKLGHEIPLLARIVAVADTFDALTSDRVYRKGVTFAEGCRILLKLKDTQLDGELVSIFVGKMDEIYDLNVLSELKN